MIAYVSSVIRAASFDDCTGYLYKVDIETGEILAQFDWNNKFDDVLNNPRGGERGIRGLEIYEDKIYAAVDQGFLVLDKDFNVLDKVLDSRNFGGVHEICLLNDKLYFTSTAYDAIVEFCLIEYKITNTWVINTLSKKNRVPPESKKIYKNSFHINSISSDNNRIIYASAKQNKYIDLFADKINHRIIGRNCFKHNTNEYEDIFVSLLTAREQFYLFDRNTLEETYTKIKFDDHDIIKGQTDLVAKPNWLRGLDRIDNDRFLFGSSPARVAIFNIKDKKIEKTIKLAEDIRNCIHGIKIDTSS